MSDETRLKTVTTSKFFKKRILNHGEQDMLKILRNMCEEVESPRCYVMGQVSYGELFGSKDTKAYNAINWMRCDLVLIGHDHIPAAIVEVHGGGHYGLNQEKRKRVETSDAIRRHVCRSAGVPLLEIVPPFTEKMMWLKLATILPQELKRAA